MNFDEARREWENDRADLVAAGIHCENVRAYIPTQWKRDMNLALDEARMAFDIQAPLVTDPNSAVLAMLTTVIDPEVIRVVLAPLQFAKILGERQKGKWLTETEVFPVVEMTGEVSSYGDYNNNGRAGVNLNYPQFQSYLFQTIIRYGERELERAGLSKINYVSELEIAAADILNRYANLGYGFGISGLQNYGIINNPYLGAYLTPATKVAGGTTWFTASGQPNASANEVYNDIVSLVEQLIVQTLGAVDMESKMTLAMSPQSMVALTFANSFGVNVKDLIKENFPNLMVKSAPQYGQKTSSNFQGFSAAGNAMQLIVEQIQGQQVAYAAFNEKLRAHKIIAETSAWHQKMTSGIWGTILRMPVGVVGMLGI